MEFLLRQISQSFWDGWQKSVFYARSSPDRSEYPAVPGLGTADNSAEQEAAPNLLPHY